MPCSPLSQKDLHFERRQDTRMTSFKFWSMTGIWWKPTYKLHPHVIASDGNRCIAVGGLKAWRDS
jgi:hypothetical protein